MRYRFALLFALLLMPLLCQGYTDNYPYQSVCPTGYEPDGVTKSESIPGGIIFRGAGEDKWLASYTDAKGVFRARDYWKDKWSFAQCNCTSYAAFMMNVYFPSFSDDEYSFNNGYGGVRWGNGGNWDDAARSVGISVDRNPIPGDIAYWNTLGGYGHVAFVEKVHFDANGNKTGVDFTEYNNPEPYKWHQEINAPVNTPDGYIHILAYEEGVSSLHYMDCYEMHCEGQTPEEWSRILQSVVGYRCKNCNGEHQAVADAFYNGPVFGGSDPGGGSVTPPPLSEPRNDLVPHVNAYRTTGDKRQVTADSLTGPTLPVMEGEVLRVEQIMDSKYSDASKWFREQFNSIYTTVWYRIVTADKTTVAVPWTELFTRKFDPGKLEKGESYGESTNFTVPVGYPNHYLVLASCTDPTDRVLEKSESTTRRNPARNPDECGTNNATRKEWLWINSKPRSVDYTIQGAGMINAPDYFWIGKPYRVWYEGVNLGPDASTDRIAVSIKIINPNGTRTTLLTRSIEPANLTPNAVYLDQPADIFTTPTVPGAYWFEFCINADGKPETNRNNNCFFYRKEVRDPNVSDTVGMYRCPVIRSDTWAAWSNQPYSPPFTSDGKLFFTPWCLESNSGYLQIFVAGSETKWIHETIHVRNGVNGTQIALSAMCSETKSGSWCPGVARLFLQSTSIDTGVTEKPTLILAYVCTWDGVAWRCAYVQQAATQAARQ